MTINIEPLKARHDATEDDDLLKLDRQLCFALYAATRSMTASYRPMLSEMGLTYPQYLALLVLWEKDGLTLSEIGARLFLDSGTLTPLMKRMEAAGLVARKRRVEDEREVEIWLTHAGRNLQPRALDARRTIACRLAMSEDEIARLRVEIMGLIDRLEKNCDLSLADR